MNITPDQLQDALGVSAQQAVWIAKGAEIGADVVMALLIVTVGWLASRWASQLLLRVVEARSLDLSLGRFLASIVRWTVILASVIAAIEALGFATTSLMAVFASAGLAVGLALQGSLSNFASGVMTLLFRPFQIGDVVTVAGSTGRVDEIGLFATTLITADNQKVIIPNSAVTAGTIVNATVMGTRRADVPVGVAYGEDPERVRAVLLRAAALCPSVLSEPGPTVAFVGLGSSSIDFLVMGWCAAGDYLAALNEIRTSAYVELGREGIEIPFDQVVLHGAEGLSHSLAS